jgi:hypothetical protein
MNNFENQGLLPVRTLPGHFIDWFLNMSEGFYEEFENEVNYGDLKEKIIYKISRTQIDNVAELTPERRITLYENYNQYLWCICYALVTAYTEGFEKPTISGTYSGKIHDSDLIKEAYSVLSNGLRLRRHFTTDDFFRLPNPETRSTEYYVLKANGLYTAGMTFILFHEFAHQYYGHISHFSEGDQSKNEEMDADNYAIDQLSQSFSTERGKTLKGGIIAGIISLMLLNSKLGGGETHPDLDHRLGSALAKLELEENDSIWGLATLGVKFWATHFDKTLDSKESFETTKEMFYYYYHQLIEFRS